MLHPDLKIMHTAITDEEQVEPFFGLEWVMCHIEQFWLQIEFSKDRAAFIGWGDEYTEDVFYFDNGNGNKNSFDLIINVCPEERMMCYDDKIIRDIVFYFCETGKRNPKYNWIEDEG